MPTSISTTGSEPVTVDEAKLAARVDTADLDALIGGVITAARQQAEHITGRTYRPQVRRAELAGWPDVDTAIAVHSATACVVRYWTGSEFTVLDASAYVFAPGGIGNNGTILAPVLGTSWPALADRAAGPRVQIDLTAGPDSPADVPEQVKLYIKAQVASWVNNPEALSGRSVQFNPLLASLLDAERLYI